MSLFEVSKHFSLAYLAEGVYAAIHVEGGAAICNAGLIDLGDLLVVFDTFLTPQAARDLRHFAINTLGRVPDIVVNSHYHNDHTWGNPVFEKATLITSTRTCQLMAAEGKEELEWCRAHAAEKLEAQRLMYKKAQGEEERQALLGMLGYYEGLVEALPHLAICKPDLTFEREMALHGDKRAAQLITFEGGHTASDTVLYLPSEGILFMSDLLFVRSHPYLSEGDPQKLIAALESILELDAQSYVPGHGPFGTREDLELMIDYATFCIDAVEACIKAGSGLETLLNTEIPGKFSSWGLPHMFAGNLEALYEKMKRKSV